MHVRAWSFVPLNLCAQIREIGVGRLLVMPGVGVTAGMLWCWSECTCRCTICCRFDDDWASIGGQRAEWTEGSASH